MADAMLPQAADPALRRRLITPEGVDLGLALASAPQRVAAFLVDILILIVSLIVLTIVAALGLLGLQDSGGLSLAAIIWLLGFFLLRNFYFILMEMGPRAATVGKRATGLRVVARNGGRLTADAVIARNLMREIEFYLPLSFLGYRATDGSADAVMAAAGLLWAGIFLLFPLFNKDRLRIGDLLAGTWVIHAPKRNLGLDLLDEMEEEGPRYRFTDAQLDAYGIFELQTLEAVLRQANASAMEAVSVSIRTKTGYPDVENDAEFLSDYYEALRMRLERKLLFGRRRVDKHDV